MVVHTSSLPKGFSFTPVDVMTYPRPVLGPAAAAAGSCRRYDGCLRTPAVLAFRSGSSLGLMAMPWSGPVSV
jgi:hypothetical protein